MARLPVPGSDDNIWGQVLNDYLSVEHNADGTLKSTGTLAGKANDVAVVHTTGAEAIAGTKTFAASPVLPAPSLSSHAATKAYVDGVAMAGSPNVVQKGELVINVQDHGAKADGSTDDSAALQAAINAAAVHGGIVFLPASTAAYIVSAPLDGASKVAIRGAGMGLTVIKAAADFTGDRAIIGGVPNTPVPCGVFNYQGTYGGSSGPTFQYVEVGHLTIDVTATDTSVAVNTYSAVFQDYSQMRHAEFHHIEYLGTSVGQGVLLQGLGRNTGGWSYDLHIHDIHALNGAGTVSTYLYAAEPTAKYSNVTIENIFSLVTNISGIKDDRVAVVGAQLFANSGTTPAMVENITVRNTHTVMDAGQNVTGLVNGVKIDSGTRTVLRGIKVLDTFFRGDANLTYTSGSEAMGAPVYCLMTGAGHANSDADATAPQGYIEDLVVDGVYSTWSGPLVLKTARYDTAPSLMVRNVNMRNVLTDVGGTRFHALMVIYGSTTAVGDEMVLIDGVHLHAATTSGFNQPLVPSAGISFTGNGTAGSGGNGGTNTDTATPVPSGYSGKIIVSNTVIDAGTLTIPDAITANRAERGYTPWATGWTNFAFENIKTVGAFTTTLNMGAAAYTARSVTGVADVSATPVTHAFNPVSKSANYTAASWDAVLCTATLTVTAPAAPAVGDQFVVNRHGAGTGNVITVAANSGQTIAGVAAIIVNRPPGGNYAGTTTFTYMGSSDWQITSSVGTDAGQGLQIDGYLQYASGIYGTKVDSYSGAHTTLPNDHVLLCTNSWTLTMTPKSGQFLAVCNVGTGVITLTPSSGTLDSVSSRILAAGTSVTLWSDGTNWYTTGGYTPTVNHTFSPVTKAASYTAASWDAILCTATLTVTMPASPMSGDQIMVARHGAGAGNVITLAANTGQTIAGLTTVAINRPPGGSYAGIVTLTYMGSGDWQITADAGTDAGQSMQVDGYLQYASGLYGTKVNSYSGAHTSLPDDHVSLCTGTWTFTLVPKSGQYMVVCNTGSGTVTLSPQSGTVDGTASRTLPAGTAATLWSDGTNWYTTGSTMPVVPNNTLMGNVSGAVAVPGGLTAAQALSLLSASATAVFDWNTQRITNIGDATVATDALNRQTGDARYNRNPSIPSGGLAQTFDRLGAPASGTYPLTSGTLALFALWIPKGTVISSISFRTTGSGAATAPTHQWFGLFDSNRNLLAVTADDTATAWANSATKTLTLTAQYTTTASGLFYSGIMTTATTPPTLAAVASSGFINGMAPIIAGTADTGMSTAPTTGSFTAAALVSVSAIVWSWVS